jgi:hypothetical protein
VEGLARLVALSRWVRGGGQVRLVCDGSGRPPAPGARGRVDRSRPRSTVSEASRLIEIVHVGAGRDADGHIERALERSSSPRGITVVSSDRRLKSAAKRRRAAWVSSEAFLRQLAADAGGPRARRAGPSAGRPGVPLSRPETARWMRLFGMAADAPQAAEPRGEQRAPTMIEPRALAESIESSSAAAAEDWTGGLSPADLDMERWLSDADHPELKRRLAGARGESQRRLRRRSSS